MKRFYQYLWIFSSVQLVFSLSILSCFNVPKHSSVYNGRNYWSGSNICAATVFLWSLTCCTSNTHRLPEILTTKQREGKEIRQMKTMKYGQKNSKVNGGDKKTDRQGLDLEDSPNEMLIIEDLRNHLISKLGVLDPMMCLPKALCGLSSASTASPNSSSELVKDYLHHMKTVILSTTTTPTPLLSVTKKVNGTSHGSKLSDDEGADEENSDDEESESEEDDENEDSDNEDTSEEDEDEDEEEEERHRPRPDKFYDNYNRYRTDITDEDNNDDDVPTESDEQLLRDYLTDKTEVTQYLDEEDFQDVPSWWDHVPTKEFDFDVPPPLSWVSSLTSYMPSSMTSWLASALPSFSFDFGAENRKEGVFDKDPFFTTFRSGGRSLSESSKSSGSEIIKDQQLSSDFQAKLAKRRKILNQYRKLQKKIKRRQERKQRFRKKPSPSSMKKILKKIKRMNKMKGNLTKVVLSKRIIQQELLDGMDDELTQIENPIARLKTAVEIGKKLDDPRKCNILFSACPWKYDEVLEIIEDSHKYVKSTSSEVKKGKVMKTSTKINGGKGSAMEKLKQSLKANSKNASKPTIDHLGKETVVKHPLPGGGHLEVKFSHSESNKVKNKNSKTKKLSYSSLLKPFLETKDLGVKIAKKKKKLKRPIEYKYPKYNYRVSFPNTDQKTILISQYEEEEEMATKRPKRTRQTTTTTTEAPTTTTLKPPKLAQTNPSSEMMSSEIDVEDSGENIIIRIPKEKSPANTYGRNPLLFNPFRIYSPQYPSYTNQQQQQPQPFPTPTLIPTPQYYNQYYQPQLQIQTQPQLQPAPAPAPWYYYNNNNRNHFQYKRAWEPNHNRYFKNNIN